VRQTLEPQLERLRSPLPQAATDIA
jgi:hypothetical protein